MKVDDCKPLVEVIRGNIVESIHYGAFIVIDSNGKVLAHEGNHHLMTYPRSSIKPFQALPFIEMGGAEAFDLSGEEIAIMCASHSGTDRHRAVLQSMHKKIGISEDDLACGVHWPGDSATREVMKKAGQEPGPLHHNCSGKHTGMLAHACLRSLTKQAYLEPNHPVQTTIRKSLSEMVAMTPEEMPAGIDGCSAPVYGVPLKNMAQAVANMADPSNLGANRSQACQLITAAMRQHPVMVAGPGKFDTELMITARGDVFSKGGAEGYQIIGVMPGVRGKESPGLGIAIKISDGDHSGRARTCVSLSILAALGILDPAQLSQLECYGNKPVKNWRDLIVGEIRTVFSMTEQEALTH